MDLISSIGIYFMLLFLFVLTVGFFLWMKKGCFGLRLKDSMPFIIFTLNAQKS
jgi:accessory gene regulator protein AgrB